MSVPADAFRKVFEYSLLEAEGAVKHYRSLLGLPPVKSSTECAKELENLESQLQEKNKENEVLHRKVHDLSCKLSQAYRECDKFKGKLHQLHKLIEEVCP